MVNLDVLHKALALVSAVNELAKGTKHYNKAGKLLTTEKEILETLRNEGSVSLEFLCSPGAGVNQ